MTLRAALFALPLCVSFAAPPAAAQSFDCHKASKPDEFAICDSRSLSNLDTEMAALWWVENQLPFMMGMRGEIHDNQTDFLKQRGACGSDADCIETLYDKRIAKIKSVISSSMDEYCKAIELC